MTATLPSAAERRISRTLGQIQSDIQTLKAGASSSQLDYSTLLYPLAIRDPSTGDLVGTVGQQPDGGVALIPVGGPPPPQPSDPIVTPIMAGLNVEWDGRFVGDAPKPTNFGYIAVHVGPTNTFITDPSNMVGVLTEAGSIPVAPLSTQMFVRFVPSNNSTPPVTGPATATVAGTPAQVVAQAVLDGIVNEVALADRAVSTVKVQLGAVNADLVAAAAIGTAKIAGEAITAPTISAGAVVAGKLAANSVVAGNVLAGTVGANELAAGAVTAGKVAANAITAGTIAASAVTAGTLAANAVTAGAINAGAVTASKLEAVLVMATRLVAGSLTGNRAEVNAGGFEAWKGTLQTFDVDAATGNVTLIGTYKSGTSGEYIVIDPDGSIRFYQGPAGGTGTYTQFANIPNALSMTGPLEPSGRQGGIFLAETGVELNYRTPTGASIYSQLNVDISGVDIVGPGNTIRAKEGFGGINHTTIGVRNSANADQPNNVLAIGKHQNSATSEGKIWNGVMNIALTFASGFLYVNDAFNALAMPINASAFNATPSSIADKTNVKRVRDRQRGTGSPRRAADIVRKARAYEYDYLHELEERPAKPGTRHREPLLDEAGEPVLDRQGRPKMKWVDDEWAYPQPTPVKRVGPMVEDLPAEYTNPPDPVTGKPSLNVMTIAGLAFDAAADNADDVTALTARVSSLEGLGGVRVAALAAPPMSSTDGVLYEQNGTLFYRNSVGQIRKVA